MNVPAILPSAGFFRSGAAAATGAVAGVLVAQTLLVPEASATGVDGLIRAYADPMFQAQSLVILLQVMAMFIALATVAAKAFPIAPGLTILAAASLLMWQVLEILPRSIDYFVFSLDYARAYVAGSGDAGFIEEEFRRFLAWERGWRSMRQIVWASGLLLIGLAAWRAAGLGRWAGAMLLLNGARVAALFVASLAGTTLPFGRPLFVIVNVAAFGLLAFWLWRSPVPERPVERGHGVT